MTASTISVSVGETFSVSQFESAKPSVTLSGTQQEGESLQDLYVRVYMDARYFFLLALFDSLQDHRAAGIEPRPELEAWVASSLQEFSKNREFMDRIKNRNTVD